MPRCGGFAPPSAIGAPSRQKDTARNRSPPQTAGWAFAPYNHAVSLCMAPGSRCAPWRVNSRCHPDPRCCGSRISCCLQRDSSPRRLSMTLMESVRLRSAPETGALHLHGGLRQRQTRGEGETRKAHCGERRVHPLGEGSAKTQCRRVTPIPDKWALTCLKAIGIFAPVNARLTSLNKPFT